MQSIPFLRRHRKLAAEGGERERLYKSVRLLGRAQMIHVVLILNEQARSSSELEQYVLTLRLVLWNIYEKSFQSILTNYGQHFVDKMCDICKTCEFGEVHLSSISSRARCVAATCLSLRRWIVFRPDDASKKRFSWFPDWISKGKICVNLCKARNIV